MILTLTGQQYSEKVTENCVAFWKSVGIYTDAEAKAIRKFLEAFKDETFSPGSSILFTKSANGSLTLSFSKDGSIPEAGNAAWCFPFRKAELGSKTIGIAERRG
ncbi:hypothetical protein SLA2020_392380 [Shorea laevis]